MHKKIVIIVITIIGLLVLGGVFALVNNRDNTDMTQKESGAMTKEDGTTMKDDAVTKSGTFITLADFNADSSKYSDTKKVYFFHASWCPICQSIEKEVKADMSKIPTGVTLIKTDFDSSTELRKKYGVTNQYTFVQIDNDGKEIAQWSATSLEDAVAGIKP